MLDIQGNNLPGWPIDLPDNSQAISNILINNIDSDPQQEIIIGQKNGNIIAYNDDGSKYTMLAAGGILSAISTGDIDSDLIPEIAAHCYDGKLYAWKVSDLPMDRGKGEWAFYNHDIHQSGNYHYTPSRLDNYAPILTTDSMYIINEDDSLTITNFVKDADRDLMTFSTFYDDLGLNINVNQENIFIKPALNWNGSCMATIAASDGSLIDTASFVLVVKPVNDKPEIYSLTDTSFYNTDSLTLKLIFSDVDNDTLIINASSSSASVKLMLKDSLLTLKSDPGWAGTSKILVTVKDRYLSDTTSFYATVLDMNDPPQIHSIADTIVYDCDSVFINLKFSDPDKEDLTITALSSSDSVKLKIIDSTLIIKPEEGWTGLSIITINIQDNFHSDSTNFYFTVRDTTTTSVTKYSDIPESFKLFQNFPNPFNPQTRIMFALPEISTVRIDIYNIMGAHIKTLLNGEMSAGYHYVEFIAENEASGVYFYQIMTEKYREVKKIILMR